MCRWIVLFFGVVLIGSAVPSVGAAAPLLARAKKVKKVVPAPAPIDWSARANAELVVLPSAPLKDPPIEPSQESTLPTPATVRAEVQPIQPAIERTALRLGVMLESYKPSGEGRLNSGETLDYSQLPTSVMGQVDLRWLPFVQGGFAAGGYVAFGFSRQSLPLVAGSGFRYDDVTLNAIRTEVGGAFGLALTSKVNLESRFGLGRLSHVQTSRYPEFNGTYERPFGALVVDLSYHFVPQVAVLLSAVHRTPLADGSGRLAFEPVVVSGGLLVQLR